jgi:K+-sensing histidine kinase KdpD
VSEISSHGELTSASVSSEAGLEKVKLICSWQAVEWILWKILENAEKFHPDQSPIVEIVVAHSDERGISLKIADDGLTFTSSS